MSKKRTMQKPVGQPSKWNTHAKLLMPVMEDGEIIQQELVWDGSRQTLTTFRNKMPSQTWKGDEALKEFKKIVCAI